MPRSTLAEPMSDRQENYILILGDRATDLARLDITQPAEISLYVQVFDLLQRSAVHGHDARDLIKRALADLSHE